MVAEGFFDLVTRYPVRPSQDPAENRLTSALVALLREDDVLARDVLRTVLGGMPTAGHVTVTPQKAVRLGAQRWGFVDIEVEIRSLGGNALVWVEAKLDARESGDGQLHKYTQALRPRTSAVALVVLAPDRRRADLRAPDGSLLRDGTERKATGPGRTGPWFVSWQQLYEAVQAARSSRRPSNSHVGWLKNEFLTFLEEQGLRPMTLERRHVDALRWRAEADDAIAALLTAAAEIIDGKWTAKHPRPVAIPRNVYLDFRYRTSPKRVRARDGARNTQRWRPGTELSWGIDADRVFAGAVFPEAGPLRGRNNEAWLAQHATGKWKQMPDRDSRWAWQELKLQDVLGLAEGAQATRLARFVDDTFKQLLASSV